MQTYGLVIDFRYEPLGNGKVLECKVNIGDRPTNWLRVKSNASLSLVEHKPMRINDLVIVVFDDDCDDGFVDRNIPYKETVLPNDIDENTFFKEFEDGTIYKHNVKTKKITLSTPCDISITTAKNINIKTPKNISLEASIFEIKTENTKFIGGKITHDGIAIDKTHKHTQVAGNHYGGGAITTPPNG